MRMDRCVMVEKRTYSVVEMFSSDVFYRHCDWVVITLKKLRTFLNRMVSCCAMFLKE